MLNKTYFSFYFAGLHGVCEASTEVSLIKVPLDDVFIKGLLSSIEEKTPMNELLGLFMMSI